MKTKHTTTEGWNIPGFAGKALAGLTGCGILAASTNATVAAAGLDTTHAVVLWGIAAGTAIGAVAIGAAWAGKRRAIAVAILLAAGAGEAYGVLSTAERVVNERGIKAAAVEEQALQHKGAEEMLSRAQQKAARLDDDVTAETKKGGCAKVCQGLKAQRDQAVADAGTAMVFYQAHPAPVVQSGALAKALGISATGVDLILAGLASVAGNGLAALLIAFAAHASHRPVVTVAAPIAAPVADEDFADKLGRYLDGLLAEGGTVPSQKALADALGVHKSTISRNARKLEREGRLTRSTPNGRPVMLRVVA